MNAKRMIDLGTERKSPNGRALKWFLVRIFDSMRARGEETRRILK